MLSQQTHRSPEEVLSTRAFGSLEGGWIEIFRAGDYAERGRWSPRDLDQLAATYNPRLHAAPVVVGHPQHDAPAFAWVRALRRAGASLWAQLEQVDPAFERLLRAGRFRTRSVALYTHFSPTRGPYLRHVGFLGAQIPEVKALAPLRFAEAPTVTVEFPHAEPPCGSLVTPSAAAAEAEAKPALSRVEGSRGLLVKKQIPRAARNDNDAAAANDDTPSEDPMPESKSKLDAFFDHLRSFFNSDPEASSGRAGIRPQPVSGGTGVSPVVSGKVPFDLAQGKQGLGQPDSSFAEKIAQLEQRLDQLAEEKRAAEHELAAHDTVARRQEIATFVETLRGRGKFPPVFERLGVRTFMERLAEIDATTSSASSASFASSASTETKEAQEAKEAEDKPGSLLAWFQEFLTRLPAIVDFSELISETRVQSASSGHDKLVRFAEPQRGVVIDPASVELAQRAQALAAELGTSYAEALARLRAERAAQSTGMKA